ncbi:glycosyltransferase [Heliophilum fasciatum]|uniref:Glycosyl transferase family 4 n=1 Tax=Heliophilum fasciatum TaxID=35700 RepID=A0A4V6NRN5_9FIRM|nr:glycosyltransferase [Heliophilum fasciatum]MCW2278983.1 glycosyltransferase involved in cell wall biosynthesis [Heliophilum fasciatum]TCP64066.1 glycosyl transferase family 4 [Heliophilum fasciatum]
MSRPIRVLHIIGGGEIGGAEIHILDLARHLDPAEVELHLCCLFPEPLLQRARLLGIPATAVPMRSKVDVTSWWHVLQTVMRIQPDLVHTHGVRANLLGRLAAKVAGVPCTVTTVHSVLEFDYPDAATRWFNTWSERITAPLTDRFIVVAEFLKAYLVKQGIAPAKITVIHNGIDEAKFLPRFWAEKNALALGTDNKGAAPTAALPMTMERTKITESPAEGELTEVAGLLETAELAEAASLPEASEMTQEEWRFLRRRGVRQMLGIDDQVPVVGMVGRFHTVKGHSILVTAAREILKIDRRVVFLLIGDGNLRPEIQAQVELDGMTDNFVFTGFREDVADLYWAMDILALPSLSEGLCLTLMEGMLCACPPVATGVGGNPEIVSHEKNGLIVPSGDALGLAAALLRLIQNPQEALRLGQCARKTILERFAVRRTAERTAALYRQLAQGKRNNASDAEMEGNSE